MAEGYFGIWHERRTAPTKNMQRVVNPPPTMGGHSAARRCHRSCSELECLQPAVAADRVAENILRRLVLDELPVGPLYLLKPLVRTSISRLSGLTAIAAAPSAT